MRLKECEEVALAIINANIDNELKIRALDIIREPGFFADEVEIGKQTKDEDYSEKEIPNLPKKWERDVVVFKKTLTSDFRGVCEE